MSGRWGSERTQRLKTLNVNKSNNNNCGLSKGTQQWSWFHTWEISAAGTTQYSLGCLRWLLLLVVLPPTERKCRIWDNQFQSDNCLWQFGQLVVLALAFYSRNPHSCCSPLQKDTFHATSWVLPLTDGPSAQNLELEGVYKDHRIIS